MGATAVVHPANPIMQPMAWASSMTSHRSQQGCDERAELHPPLPNSTIDTNHYPHSISACRPYNRKSKSAISQC
jgi:hypothetical protein